MLFPNIESKADVLEALALLDAAGGSHLPIMVMIESPIAVLRAEEIAGASDRIACIVMATSDLLNQLHARRTPDRIALVHSLSHVLLAGRAYDRAVVDGISTDLKDMQSFEFACRLGRDLGFDGKSLVHPFQLPYCNDAFTPKPHDLAAALDVIEALGQGLPRRPRHRGRERPPHRGPPREGRQAPARARRHDQETRGRPVTQTISLHAVPRPAGGYFFEDYAVGRRFHHVTPRTLTEGDASLYIALTGARQPVHCWLPLARAMGHRACPLDDFLVFNVAFGKTVPDISYNADREPRLRGPALPRARVRRRHDLLRVRGDRGQGEFQRQERRGLRALARLQPGPRSRCSRWARWVMIAMRKARDEARVHAPEVPELPKAVEPSRLSVPKFLKPAALEPRFTGSAMLWEDYTPGDVIDHPGGMTLEESDHMLATRLYQNTARIHFDAFAAHNNPFGRRLVYGGHVISVCRALSYDGLENAFAVAAIHGGTHANPTFAGDTLYCRHIVLGREKIPGRDDVGALRLRMIGAKNVALAELPEPGEKNPAVVLDLDYSVLIPRRQSA